MARGTWDYGVYQTKRVGATLADMADLAVRMGSIVEYDRRGDIVSLDDFENTIIKWVGFIVGAGAIALDSTTAKSGSQSLKITTGVLGGNRTIIRKSLITLGTLKVGAEISLCSLQAGCDFYLAILYWDGTIGRRANIWYDHSLTTFFVEDTVAGNWTFVANVGAMRAGEHLFYPMKLVADFTTNLYARFLFGGAEHPIDTIVIPPIVLAGAPYFRADIEVRNILAASEDAWVDDFIFTQNEP